MMHTHLANHPSFESFLRRMSLSFHAVTEKMMKKTYLHTPLSRSLPVNCWRPDSILYRRHCYLGRKSRSAEWMRNWETSEKSSRNAWKLVPRNKLKFRKDSKGWAWNVEDPLCWLSSHKSVHVLQRHICIIALTLWWDSGSKGVLIK
jgi:hypothetical protein